jgi:hypothetical protein
MIRRLPWSILASALLCAPGVLPFAAAQAPAAKAAPRAVHGRVEDHGGIRLLRVWGTPAERGYAHGFLLAADVARGAIAEFTARFARQKGLLELARGAVGRLIAYPDDVRAEIEALYQGLLAAGVERQMPELERAFDLQDLLVANALDVFGLMGCSGFAVWGDGVDGGGVLAGRNFDWPFTGDHMLDGTILLVQHQDGGRAIASVTWPGYVATVTGVSSDGVAVFLHVGTGKITRTPEPDSWPTAVAARAILERVRPADGDRALATAEELLGYTSPPAGYLTRVVLPGVRPGSAPSAVFETDAKRCVRAEQHGATCVVTNHFVTRTDGRGASKDSLSRETRVRTGLDGCLSGGDRKVSVDEAWQVLVSVQRGGGHAFGTLHALVFRAEPWCFELRVGQYEEKGVVAAPSSARRYSLARDALFAAPPAAGARPAAK